MLLTNPERESAGRAYLAQRSALAKRLAAGYPYRHIQIVDDCSLDGDVLASLLRKVLGADVRIMTARSIAAAREQWQQRRPDLMFLDDRLGPAGSANIHLPQLRRLGFNGPIVVMSGLMGRERRGEMIRLGAVEAVHKDDLVSARLIELLLLVIDRGGGRPTA